jgi:MscS family membrane protein
MLPPAAKRSVALSAWLVLAGLVLAGNTLAQQQPTLKEVIGGKEKQEQVTEKPEQKEEPKAEQKPTQTKGQPAGPDDEFDRGVPRTSVEGFLKAASERNYERAAEYLDLRNLPRGLDQSDGPTLARELKIVFDRALWIDLDALSADPKGYADDGLPTYRDRVGRIETPEKTFDILVQQVPRGDGVSIWKFSSITVAQIPQLYAEFGYGLFGEIFPAWFLDLHFLGIPVWQWVSMLVLALPVYLLALLVIKLIIFVLRRTRTGLSHQLERVLTGPGLLLLFTMIGRAVINLLGPSVTVRAIMQTKTLPLIALAWAGVRLFDVVEVRVAERLRRRDRRDLIVLLRPVKNTLKIAVILIIALVWLDNIGFRVTTVLAGLGIGGLAVALAAQKSIENFIGAITLYGSRPVSVGDFCRFGDKIGTVEEIGLRSTRVRTLDRTLVSVPNAEFANLHLDNFTMRDRIWYHPRIRLRYETTPDQIRYILVEIRKMLYAHPKVHPDPARIRFEQFGTYSLELNVFAYVDVTDYGEFLEVAEDLNLRIMDIVANAGSRLAVPAQTTYLERADKLDGQLAQAAEAHVKEWREHNALYLPSFPQEKIAELAGSLDYPPTGSPNAPART